MKHIYIYTYNFCSFNKSRYIYRIYLWANFLGEIYTESFKVVSPMRLDKIMKNKKITYIYYYSGSWRSWGHLLFRRLLSRIRTNEWRVWMGCDANFQTWMFALSLMTLCIYIYIYIYILTIPYNLHYKKFIQYPCAKLIFLSKIFFFSLCIRKAKSSRFFSWYLKRTFSKHIKMNNIN